MSGRSHMHSRWGAKAPREDEMTTYLLMAALWGGMAWSAGTIIERRKRNER